MSIYIYPHYHHFYLKSLSFPRTSGPWLHWRSFRVDESLTQKFCFEAASCLHGWKIDVNHEAKAFTAV